MPDIVSPITGRRYSRSAGRVLDTRPAPPAPVESAEPVDLTVPDELLPFWPAGEAPGEVAHIALLRQRHQRNYDGLSNVPELPPLLPADVERERHLYRLRVAEVARATAESRRAGDARRTAVSTCPGCQQPDVLPVRPAGGGAWMRDGRCNRQLPVLGSFVCCDTCLPLFEARSRELLRAEQLEQGMRGDLVDAHVLHLLEQNKQAG